MDEFYYHYYKNLFNGQYQKDKTSLDKNGARDDGFMDEILVKIKFWSN